VIHGDHVGQRRRIASGDLQAGEAGAERGGSTLGNPLVRQAAEVIQAAEAFAFHEGFNAIDNHCVTFVAVDR